MKGYPTHAYKTKREWWTAKEMTLNAFATHCKRQNIPLELNENYKV